MNDDYSELPVMRLMLHLNHPNLEDCYAEGYEIGRVEQSDSLNPYKAASQEHAQWSEGWWAGFYGEEPLYAQTSGVLPESELMQADMATLSLGGAANDDEWSQEDVRTWAKKVAKVAGAIAATAVVGYQIIDLVA